MSARSCGPAACLLSFEPEQGDRDGKTHNIKIEVPGRKAIEVRSRREFAVDGGRKRTTEDLLAETLKSPLLATDLGLKVATYTLGEPASNKLKIIVAGEIEVARSTPMPGSRSPTRSSTRRGTSSRARSSPR